MAKRLGIRYVCSSCGAISTTWIGRCRVCGHWNTLQEQLEVSTSTAGASGARLKVETITQAAAAKTKRISTKINDVDDGRGGGVVAGSVDLLAGEPSIGKSTLLFQIANNIAANHNVLYISGEESGQQIALRAERLGVKSKSLQLGISTVANDIATTIASGDFDVVVIDSIQSIAVNEIA